MDNNEGKKISLLLLQIIEQFTYKINFEDYNSDQVSISYENYSDYLYITFLFCCKRCLNV